MKFVIDVPFHIASFIRRWGGLSVRLIRHATMPRYDWLIFKSCIREAHKRIIIIFIIIIITSDTGKSKL